MGTTTMSEKIIEASKSPAKRSIGCSVIAQASSGVLQTSKNPWFLRSSRNSATQQGLKTTTLQTWQISSGLSHDPDWRSFGLFA